MTSQQEILDRIGKLLALAEDEAATPGEVNAALKKIVLLQQKHGITEEGMRRHIHSQSDGSISFSVEAVVNEQLYGSLKLTRWPTWCGIAASTAGGTKIYTSDSNIFVYGLPSDVAVTKILFQFCLNAMDKHRKHWCWNNGIALRNPKAKQYADGFCRGLMEAGKEAYRQSKVESSTAPVATNTGTSLVLISNITRAKENALILYGREKLNLGRSGRSFPVKEGEAYKTGYNTGKSVSLGRNSLGG